MKSLFKKPCAYCKKLFKAPGNTKYCTAMCKKLAKIERETSSEQLCKWCRTAYLNPNSEFCSTICEDSYARAHRPKPLPLKDEDRLENTVKKAKESGLSYGYLVGQQYTKRQKEK